MIWDAGHSIFHSPICNGKIKNAEDPQRWQAAEMLQVPKGWQRAVWQQAAGPESSQSQAGIATGPQVVAGPAQKET